MNPLWSFRRRGSWPLAGSTPLAFALQGGGAHGAFTWGVLDALLEDGCVDPVAFSGASAGALNAAVTAQGLVEGGRRDGRDRARERLARFWEAVGTRLPFEWLTLGSGSRTTLVPAARWWLQWAQFVSPYHANPLDLDPLRDILAAQIDFERLRRARTPQLFIAATAARSGRLRLFRNAELDLAPLLASACLPMLQKAVVIDGEAYWDGGFSANPAVFPLVREAPARDLLLVLLAPRDFGETPTAADEIRRRATEIGFSAAFLREMQTLADASAAARARRLRLGGDARLAAARWHAIDGETVLDRLAPESRLIAHRPFLLHLRDAGRARALDWLARHGSALGRRSTVDLETLFGSRAGAAEASAAPHAA